MDYVKLAHHGSKNNISEELCSIIQANNFIISTNGGNGKTKHPDRKTIAKIVCSKYRNINQPITFWFNYSKESIEDRNGLVCTKDEEKYFNFICNIIPKGSYL